MASLRVRSEVFLREDIESILRALDAANGEFAERLQVPPADEFRAGFRSALEAVAQAFHSSLDDPRLSVADRLDSAYRPLARPRTLIHIPKDSRP